MRSGTSTLSPGGEPESANIELPVVAAWDRKLSKVAMLEQSNFGVEGENSKNKGLKLGWTLAAAKWGLSVAMCLLFGCYMAVLAAFPVGSLQSLKEKFVLSMVDTPFGKGGGMLLLFAAPLLLLSLLAIINLEISSRTSVFNKEKVKGRASMQNLPVITRGRMGIVSAAELLWFVLFLLMFCWIMGNYIVRDLKAFETIHLKPFEKMWGKKLKRIGLHLGFIGIICLNLLFLPVSRGSVLLRTIDIPYEHAVKYHQWLGHFMMTLFTLHGLSYSIAWYSEDRLSKLFDWAPHKVANFAGVIALLAGVTMWITSIGWVRKKYFETFYWTHHLYIVFALFMTFHIGEVLFNVTFCGLFLFVLDRFLRFCQSRNSVGVLSTKLLPCGTFELTLAKSRGVKYHALSYIYLNIPEVSKLQWHPFSVASSPYDGDSWLKILIKPYGGWTLQLQDLVSAVVKLGRCPSNINAAIEGPYGHESNFFLQYEMLVLVAGGIGISPFVALLRDLLQRYQRGQPNLPSTVYLIWAVQKSEELQLLGLIPASTICPDYKLKFNLEVHAFVTRETSPFSLERGSETSDLHQHDRFKMPRILASLIDAEASKHPMSIVAGAGNNMWITACFLASLLGYIIVYLLINLFIVQPFEQGSVKDGNSSGSIPRWITGLFSVISMILGVVICGGSVVSLWNFLGRLHQNTSGAVEENVHLLSTSDNDGTAFTDECADRLLDPSNTYFGHRPNLRGMREVFLNYLRLFISFILHRFRSDKSLRHRLLLLHTMLCYILLRLH
ncbi:hypothetical protein KC19_VG064700 [Ceratodon purpureus]|uniref:FAD-binding FR-type domain-containing protein n=2 Tax=Ceratodon purpureus TaxID=3225 RepID=A0A8T0HML2_CERPU|nr:hypothetical protein KC19_VG064700 [Ceratodon purpureus]